MKAETIETAGAQPVNPSCLVERKPLADALAFLCRIVERRNTIPILSNVLIGPTDDGAAMRLVATDLDLQAEMIVPAEWFVPGSWTVAAHALRDIVKKAAGEDVSLSMESERLTIASGRNRNTLATLPVDDFPVLTGPGDGAARFEIPADQFARDLAAIAPAMSKEETRYYLNGVAAQIRGPRLILVATDGHQLASVTRDAPAGAEALADSIVPRKTVASILALLKKAGPDPLSMEMGETKASIVGAGFRIVAKLIDGDFPDWQAVAAKALGESELQPVLMVELEPRLNAPAIAALAKAAGVTLSVETGERAAVLTSPDYPEWQGVSSFMNEDYNGGRYSYGYDDAASSQAIEYLDGLRERYGLPEMEGAQLIIVRGRAVGRTYGEQYWQDAQYEERPCFERLTMVRVKVQEHKLVYPDGAYSVFLPRNEQPVVSALSVTVDGETMPLRQDARGGLELSKEAVAALCGPVNKASHVKISALQFLHGAIVTGLFIPGPLWTIDGKRSRRMTDREQLNAYCEDPAGFMEMIRARPAGEPCRIAQENEAGPVLVAFATAAMQHSQNATDAATDDNRLSEAAAAIVAFARAASVLRPLSTPPAEPAVEQGAPAASLCDASEAGNEVAIEPGASVPTETDRLDRLEVRLAALETAKVPLSVESEAPPVSMERPGRSPARERLLRRYLAMRADRKRIVAAEERAEHWHSRFGSESARADSLGRAAMRYKRDAKLAAGTAARASAAKRRLAMRGVAMRQRAALDRSALLAAGDFVRQLEAERSAQPIQHPNEPAPDLVAQLHREREAAAGKIAAAERRAGAMERANGQLSDELVKLSGRAIRAEQALQLYRVTPAPLAITYDARVPVRVGYGGGR